MHFLEKHGCSVSSTKYGYQVLRIESHRGSGPHIEHWYKTRLLSKRVEDWYAIILLDF